MNARVPVIPYQAGMVPHQSQVPHLPRVQHPSPVIPYDTRQADFALRRLARLRHQITLPLAFAAAALVRRRAWLEFGYLNEQRFARDLFGWTAKTLRNLAALDAPFRKFPELVRAVTGTDGRAPVGRCAALRIAGVARADTIDMWIDRARTLSVRELVRLVRDAHNTETNATVTDRMEAAAGEPAGEAPTGKPVEEAVKKVVVRVEMAPEARMAFNEVEELHRAFAGYEAPVSEFLVDLMAEVMASGLWAPDPTGPGRLEAVHAAGRGTNDARRGTPDTGHGTTDAGRGTTATGRGTPDAGPTSAGWRSDGAGSGALRRAACTTVEDWPTNTTEGRLATRLLKEFDRDLRDLTQIMRRLETIDRGDDPKDVSAKNEDAQDGTPGSKIEGPADSCVPRGRLLQIRGIARILRRLVLYENQIEIRMGALLLEQHERRAWPAFGYRSLGEYAEQRLEWPSSTARRRVDVARALRRLPVVRAAHEAGRIALEHTEWIVRATRKLTLTEPEQQEWVKRVSGLTSRRLREQNRILERERLEQRAEVARAVTQWHGARKRRRNDASARPQAETHGGLTGEACGPPAVAAMVAPDGPNGPNGPDASARRFPVPLHDSGTAAAPRAPEVTARRFPLRPADVATGAPNANARRFLPPDDATWLRSVSRVRGQTRDRVLELEGSLFGRVLARGAMLEVTTAFRISEDLAQDFLSCLVTLRDCVCEQALATMSAAEEARTLLSVRIAAAYLDQNSQVRHRLRSQQSSRWQQSSRVPQSHGSPNSCVPLWVGVLAALEICVLEWDDPRRITPTRALQRRVLERDGYRCTVPGCTVRRNLQVNHIRMRSSGGPDEEWNLHTVCALHHQDYIHGGRASVRGRAPGNMVIRIGRHEVAQWYVNDRRVRSMI